MTYVEKYNHINV
ncbi:hypothetical protein BsWGS_27093 [Bradybaena similaris]